MKKLNVFLLLMGLMISTIGMAQVIVNIGPPQWGPVGYTQVRYYYLPDVQAYYDVSTARFIYYENDGWVRRAYLPAQYRYYDLYSGYKVVMVDYRGEQPYVYYPWYKLKYKKGYQGGYQQTIGHNPGNGNHGSKGGPYTHAPYNTPSRGWGSYQPGNNGSGKGNPGHASPSNPTKPNGIVYPAKPDGNGKPTIGGGKPTIGGGKPTPSNGKPVLGNTKPTPSNGKPTLGTKPAPVNTHTPPTKGSLGNGGSKGSPSQGGSKPNGGGGQGGGKSNAGGGGSKGNAGGGHGGGKGK